MEAERKENLLNLNNKIMEMQPAPGGICGQKPIWELFV